MHHQTVASRRAVMRWWRPETCAGPDAVRLWLSPGLGFSCLGCLRWVLMVSPSSSVPLHMGLVLPRPGRRAPDLSGCPTRHAMPTQLPVSRASLPSQLRVRRMCGLPN